MKTDGRDALLLARLLRMDDLTVVTVPSVEQEAARDLVRAREDCRGDLMRARHRLSKLLLRYGLVWDGKHAWTGAHDAWLRRLRAQTLWSAGTRSAFDAGYETVIAAAARRDRLDAEIAEMAAGSEFTAITQRLGCLRGISTLTGFALAVEMGDWTRFSGASIGAFVGLTPSEHSSGTSRSLGSITKTGNSHARRLLVEATWHHRLSGLMSTSRGRQGRRSPAGRRARRSPARSPGSRSAPTASPSRRTRAGPARSRGSASMNAGMFSSQFCHSPPSPCRNSSGGPSPPVSITLTRAAEDQLGAGQRRPVDRRPGRVVAVGVRRVRLGARTNALAGSARTCPMNPDTPLPYQRPCASRSTSTRRCTRTGTSSPPIAQRALRRRAPVRDAGTRGRSTGCDPSS